MGHRRGRDEARSRLSSEAEFTPCTYDEAEFSFTMRLIFAQVPAGSVLFVLKAAETRRAPDGSLQPYPGRRRLNSWCAEAARLFPNVRLLSLSDFTDSEAGDGDAEPSQAAGRGARRRSTKAWSSASAST